MTPGPWVRCAAGAMRLTALSPASMSTPASLYETAIVRPLVSCRPLHQTARTGLSRGVQISGSQKIAVVIPALVFLIPIHVAMLGVVLLVMTVMGVTNHMGWEMFPKWLVHSRLGGWLITASHHQRHHEEYKCNYGLYFRIWDRLCGTDRGLSPDA